MLDEPYATETAPPLVLVSVFAAITVAGLALATCTGNTRREAHADPPPRAEPAPSRLAGSIASVDVTGDARVYIVPGNPSVRRPLVYLHGMCSDPRHDLEAWGEVAERHGTIVALQGDLPCPEKPGRRKWSNDATSLDARLRAALEAVARIATGPLVLDDAAIVIGESMGAARSELLASRYPARYTRLVLVGSPQTPSPQSLRGARAVANLAGEHEDQSHMRQGARALADAGKRARFWVLPGATHGNYGPEGARVMDEAIGFVAAE